MHKKTDRYCGPFFFSILVGGAKGDRTPDLMTASHALSQLSYGPTGLSGKYSNLTRPVKRFPQLDIPVDAAYHPACPPRCGAPAPVPEW